MKYSEQVQRIKEKLIKAKERDRSHKVFGAGSHKYVLSSPVSENEVLQFEKTYNVKLPEAYRIFVTQIGNKGVSFQNSGAGPFYGIYPFGEALKNIISNPKNYLSKPTKIVPQMTDEEWGELNKNIDNANLRYEEYDKEFDSIFQGLLPIGSQGCSYETALVLSGDNRGRVVYIDVDRQKPIFTYEDNFLDWYERWLDEINLGYLLWSQHYWFGYVMGGTDVELIEKYKNTNNRQLKIVCLDGFSKLIRIEKPSVEFLKKEYENQNAEIKNLTLGFLTKFDYDEAKPFLKVLFDKEPLKAFQFIFWYAKNKSSEWVNEIKTILSQDINDEELFRFCTYLVETCGQDLTDLIFPYVESGNEGIKSQAKYIIEQKRISKLKGKYSYLKDKYRNKKSDEKNSLIDKIIGWFSLT